MTAATIAARPTASVPRHALRRGTRGFAAFVLFLTGMAVLAVATFVLPATAIERELLTVLIPLGVAFGIAHLVGVYGLLRRRAWVPALSLYLAAIGLGVVAFLMLMLRAGVDPLVPAGAVASGSAALETLGLSVWLAGSWLAAARFTVRAMAPADTGTRLAAVVEARPVAAPAPDRLRAGRGVFPMGAYSA